MTEYYATKLASLDIPYFIDRLGSSRVLSLLGLKRWCGFVTRENDDGLETHPSPREKMPRRKSSKWVIVTNEHWK
jgi:hypothetical protein